MKLDPADELKVAHNILDRGNDVSSEFYTMMELMLFREWVKREVAGTAHIPQHEMCEILKCDKRTLRRLSYALTEANRWNIVPGTGRVSTSYSPTFLNSVLEGKEGFSHDN